MTSPPTQQERSTFYRAAVLGLRALDARESAPRRLGTDAEARCSHFAGTLDIGDRIDILKTAAKLGVAWSNIEAAERAGADGPDWPLLLELVRRAIDVVVDDLVKRPEQTQPLAWPGALARYGLSGALSCIVDSAERGDARAILRTVPSHAYGPAPSSNGRLAVPAPLPSQQIVMPDARLANAHRAEG